MSQWVPSLKAHGDEVVQAVLTAGASDCEELAAQGIVFETDTDTEVFAKLVTSELDGWNDEAGARGSRVVREWSRRAVVAVVHFVWFVHVVETAAVRGTGRLYGVRKA